ncbi:sensor histidine kinase [Ornithinicoccus halotolerans]|uniref:sensor histidine kinase n=1 Tax=Ornithinicoccus halotolerans TaxID=1748220 RepID=UPI0012963D4C|nr:histidine kinase [Ornithinicoccus halotolerans]
MAGDRAASPLRRTVHLLIGGAVGLACLLVASAVYAVTAPSTDPVPTGFLLLALVLAVGIGLLPGVRELQVAGARDLLGVGRSAVVTPQPLRWADRWRTALWTLLHQGVGFGVGALLTFVIVAPALLVTLALGRASLDPVLPQSRPGSALGWAAVVAATVGGIALAVLLVQLAGRAAAWSAPLLLGPSGEDRLAEAERALATERRWRRVSRDLHDGVGHSLSTISLQAAAARRVITAGSGTDQRERAAAALATIEQLAGDAVAELDRALRLLRDGEAPPAAGSLADLPGLVERQRALGTEVLARLPGGHDLTGLPATVNAVAARVCAEALANAGKHGGPGPVLLEVRRERRGLRVLVENPRAEQPHRRPGVGGHGLAGLHETLGLLGGRLEAGPQGSRWRLEAWLPAPTREGA